MFTIRVSMAFVTVVMLAACAQVAAATRSVPGGYSTIQAAINAASNGDEVVVSAGTYHERLNFGGKAITVRSTTPSNPAVVAATIINGDKGGSVATFNHSETTASVLSGFTLTNGSGTSADSNLEGGGVYCLSASPSITNNIISGNKCTFGGGVFCRNGSPIIKGNTISGNTVVYSGGGVYTIDGTPSLSNNIITGNTADYWGGGVHIQHGGGSITNNTLHGNASNRYYGAGITAVASVTIHSNIVTSATSGGGIWILSGSTVDVKYCDVHGNVGGNYVNVTDQTGSNGNVSLDPLYANVAARDFHEKSVAGRWNGTGWVNDTVCSPCIDAGGPSASYSQEPAPNGGRLNMGAYGNTPYASKSGTVVVPTYSVSGQIATGSSAPLGGVTVTAGTQTGTTNHDGTYSVTGIAAGTYNVTPALPGYTFSPPYASVTVGPNRTDVSFVATPSSGPAPTVLVALPTGTGIKAEMPIITVAFSEPMDQGSAASAFSITPALSGALPPGWPGTFIWSGSQMRYKINTALAASTTYTVTVTSSAKSSAGVNMAKDKSWSFTTSSALGIGSHSPTGNAVPRNTTAMVVRIGFNQPMNRPTVPGALWIYKTGTIPTATATRPGGNFSWVGNEMRYTFKRPLLARTSYTVKLGAAAKSATGMSRPADFTWSFTTGAPASVPAAVTVAATPTAAGAQITIMLGSAADVTLRLRNLAGREVALLQPGLLDQGTHTLLWNGRSALGTKVPAGTYLLEVVARTDDGTQAQALASLRTGT